MSEQNDSSMCSKPGEFSWNELVTTDVAGATKFYTALLGWTTAPFGPGMDYTLFKQGEMMVGGMMQAPKPGMPAQWVCYVHVENVDATAAKVAALGGTLAMPPFDVPNVGRIAVALDPQGAAIGLFQPAAR